MADGLNEAAGSAPPLDLRAPLAMPEPGAREKWVSAGADLVVWEEPPVSIIAAQERYKKDVRPQATRTGWKVYGIVGVSLFIFSLLVAGASLAISWAVDELASLITAYPRDQQPELSEEIGRTRKRIAAMKKGN